jgi:amino acid transporter
MPDDVPPKEDKTLGTFAVAMIGVSAMFTLRTLPALADTGYQSIFFFGLAVLFFFIPISLACAELGAQFPTQGGIYIWISQAFGVRTGFLASWLEWLNNTLYVTLLLCFMVVICNHICGHVFHTALTGLQQLALMLLFLWGTTVLNFFPLKYSSLFSGLGTILGSVIPAIVLIGLGAYSLANAQSYLRTPTTLLPSFSLNNAAKFSLTTSIFTGIEATSYYIPNTKNPRKTYPKAMLLAAVVMCALFALCTLSIASLVAPHELNVLEGSIQAMEFLTNRPMLCILETMMLIGIASVLNTWVISPLKGLMIASKKGFLPNSLVKYNRYGSPQRLLVLQGILVSFMVIIFIFVNANQASFWFIEIVGMQLLMIMYLLVFGACVKLHFKKATHKYDGYRIPGGKPVFLSIIALGIFSCLTSMVLGLAKPEGTATIHISAQQYAWMVAVSTLVMLIPPLFLSARRNLPEKPCSQRAACFITSYLGWQIQNITPPEACKKAVVLLAPHTSNWDFIYGMLFKFSYPTIPIRFAIKKEVMFFPLSCLMKALGAIPIARRTTATTHAKRPHMVSVMADMLRATDELFLLIAPEGTRSYAPRWKTGFYRVAEAANVPIILGYINYAKKEMGLGPLFYPTGDIEKDTQTIQDFYRSIPGKYPEKGVR